MKIMATVLGLLAISSTVFATGGLTCKSKKSKLLFDVVESSQQTPVSAKLYYETDRIAGEDGSVQSFDLRNSESTKPIIYSQIDDTLVVVILSGSSVVSAKLDLSKMKGKAQVMISNETKTLDISCLRE